MFRRVFSRSNSNLVRVAQANQIATVTIDHSPVNLLSRAVLTDIASTFDNLGNDDSVKAVIMKSGAKGNLYSAWNIIFILFSGVYTAGLDIMEIYNRKDDEIFEYWSLLQNMWLSLYTAKTPVIAQINGTCPAAGCLMAIAADYRIMENNRKYKIGLNETQLGFAAPDWLCFNYRGLIWPNDQFQSYILRYYWLETGWTSSPTWNPFRPKRSPFNWISWSSLCSRRNRYCCRFFYL